MARSSGYRVTEGSVDRDKPGIIQLGFTKFPKYISFVCLFLVPWLLVGN